MIARPLYAAERVPAAFVGGRFSRLGWRVVHLDGERRQPVGYSSDRQGQRYMTQKEALEAARQFNRHAAECAAAAPQRPATAADEAIAMLEGRR